MRNFSNIFLVVAIAGCAIAAIYGYWICFEYPIIRSEMSYAERMAVDNRRDEKRRKQEWNSRPVARAETKNRVDSQIDAALKSLPFPDQQISKTSPTERLLRVVSWNVESGGNDPAIIAQQLNQFADCDIIALQEVRLVDQFIYDKSLPNHKTINGLTGGTDRLQILFNAARLERLVLLQPSKFEELHRFNTGRHCSPLIALFRDKSTSVEFYFVTVHLARGDAELRTEQATSLREWARAQTLPVVAVGDFNSDYNVNTLTGNDGFNAMLRDNIWHWVKPDSLIDTNWSDRNNDGIDDYPDSMLDFAFVANGAKEWKCSTEVVIRDGDFPDDEKTSDHRPVIMTLENRMPQR